MKNWELLDFTGKGLYKIYTVRLEGDKIVLVTQNILWNITPDNKLEKLLTFDMLFGGLYEIAETKTYLGTDRKLFTKSVGDFSTAPTRVADIAGVITTDKNNVVTIDDHVKGRFYSPDEQSFSFSFPKFEGWNNNFYAGMVLKGKKLFWLNSWGAKNHYEAKKKANPNLDPLTFIPQEAIWELNLETKAAIDITENLDCKNMLGMPFGPVTSLVSNRSKTKLYLSTESGIWERSVNTPGWNKIYANWGNLQLFQLPDDSILGIDTKDDKKVVSLYKNGEWLQLPDLKLKRDNIVLGATKRDNNIYVSFFERKFVAIINIFGIKPDQSNKPALATYINIENPLVAASALGQAIIATADTLYSVNKKGSKQKIINLDQQISDIIPWEGGLLLAGTNSLDYIVGNTSRTLVNSGDGRGSRVAASDSLIAYLHNKTITVLNKYLEPVTSKLLDADPANDTTFINDIAVIDNQIFVVGFNNRKNKGIPVKVAFLHIWELVGTELQYVDRIWYFNSATLDSDMADTVLHKVEVVNEKMLAVLGESDGGNTIFRWNGKDLKTNTLVKNDIFNDPFNSKDAHMLYYGLLDLQRRTVARGQFSIPRADKMLSNTNLPKTIFTNGTDFFVGSGAAYSILGRDVNKFAGSAITPYDGNDGPDATFLKTDLQLNIRKSWLTPGKGEVLLYTDKFAVVRANTDNLPTTPNPPHKNDTAIANNTYLIVW